MKSIKCKRNSLPEMIYFGNTAAYLTSNAGGHTNENEADERDISGWTYGECMLYQNQILPYGLENHVSLCFHSEIVEHCVT